MAEYIISEKALEDLNNIWIYTAENWSVEQANRYFNLMEQRKSYDGTRCYWEIDFST